MNSLLALIFNVTFLSAAYAQEFDSCRKQNSDWYRCRSDQDCVIVSNPCGHPTEAANKTHAKRAEACNLKVGAALSCPTWVAVNGQTIVPKCNAKSCMAFLDPAQAKSVERPQGPCESYNYGSCPKSCDRVCVSTCDKHSCTADCDGPGSCKAKPGK